MKKSTRAALLAGALALVSAPAYALWIYAPYVGLPPGIWVRSTVTDCEVGHDQSYYYQSQRNAEFTNQNTGTPLRRIFRFWYGGAAYFFSENYGDPRQWRVTFSNQSIKSCTNSIHFYSKNIGAAIGWNTY